MIDFLVMMAVIALIFVAATIFVALMARALLRLRGSIHASLKRKAR